MKREFLWSLAIHVIFVSATLISSPFEPKNQIDYGEVIRVSLPSMDQLPVAKPEPIAPVEIPQMLAEEDPEIPVEAPTTKPAAKIDKPKEKPKTARKPKKPIQTDAQKGDKDQSGSKEGKIDTESTGGAGSPFAGATVDDASFNYPFWFRQAFSKIGSNFRNTVLYDGTLVCVIYFQVIRSGRVLELKVVQSSGIEAFDEVCLAAVERSKPFPPLPREFREEIIGITVPIQWTPR